MTHWENFPTLPRSYAGHAEIKYLVANFHLQRRDRGQGGRVFLRSSIHIPKASYGRAITLQNVQKLATAKYEVFVSPGVCAWFLKRRIKM